jgi:hypothetical protein
MAAALRVSHDRVSQHFASVQNTFYHLKLCHFYASHPLRSSKWSKQSRTEDRTTAFQSLQHHARLSFSKAHQSRALEMYQPSISSLQKQTMGSPSTPDNRRFAKEGGFDQECTRDTVKRMASMSLAKQSMSAHPCPSHSSLGISLRV